MELLWTLYYESNYSINQTFLYSHNIIWIDNSFFVKFDGSWKDAKKWKKNDNKAWFIKYRISAKQQHCTVCTCCSNIVCST